MDEMVNGTVVNPMKYYSAIKKERSADIHNDVNESQMCYASERSQTQKVIILFM